jgi:RNA polymerase sigma-70 factor (ECF subfamily)
VSENEDLDLLVDTARRGDEQALAVLFERYRARLTKLILVRMDARVQARIDVSDVLQDAFVEAARKLPEYGKEAKIPFFLWLRMIAGERLIQLHRMHLGAAKRDAQRQVSLHGGLMPEASSMFLASQLAGQFTSADRNLIRAEIQQKLQDALDRMDPGDREVIAMRHFEELTTDEIAIVLQLTRSGVLKRYTRAIRRLRAAIRDDSDLKLEDG